MSNRCLSDGLCYLGGNSSGASVGIKMCLLTHSAGVLRNMGYLSETHLKLTYREISFVHNIRWNNPIGWNIVQSTVVSLPCYKINGRLKQMGWTNEISWDLSFRLISDCFTADYGWLYNIHWLWPHVMSLVYITHTYFTRGIFGYLYKQYQNTVLHTLDTSCS